MKKYTLLTWVMGLMLITHVSCKKESGSIGLDSGDAALNPLQIDTFTILTRTVQTDSVRGDGLTHQLLGGTKTAAFGYNEAAIVLSFSLPSAGFSFPVGIQIDSVVLQANYTGPDQYNGNLNTPMNFRAGRIDKRIYVDTPYYTNGQYSMLAPEQINGVMHDLDDSVKITENGILNTYAPQLRLRLGQDVADRLENASPADLGSNTAFQDYFNGIMVEMAAPIVVDDQGNIVYLNLKHVESGLAIYFNDTGKFLFPVGTSGVKINLFRHDFSTAADIQTQLNNPSGDFDQTYLQSMAGLRTVIEVPGLLDLLDQGVYGISDAWFRIHFDNGLTSTEFPPFSRTLLSKRDSTGALRLLFDQEIFAPYYGGSLNASEHYYEFHLMREIQFILNERKQFGRNTNTGFFLFAPTDNPVSASHLILDTRKNNPKGIRFVVSLVKTK